MRVVISPRGFYNYGQDEIEFMKKHNINVHYNDTGIPYTNNEFRALCEDADGIIVGVDTIDRDFIDSCMNLKVICKFGVGTDNIDVEYAKSKNIIVERTLGTNTNSVAEHVIAMMYADSKNLIESIADVRNNKWIKNTGRELAGKTLGIIGFGAIGRTLARYASGIGMDVIAYDIFDINKEHLELTAGKQVELGTILSESDYISLHLPLTSDTTDFISIKELELMKTECCLINSARGGIVNEGDLYTALKNSTIRSAWFDVFSSEPPLNNEKLLTLNNFYLTPHTAARTMESEKRTCELSTKLVLEGLGV